MKSWLDPVQRMLDQDGQTATFFFRDDDAGWDDPLLFRLVDIFLSRTIPIDLAVIPATLHSRLSQQLLARHNDSGGSIRMHQHGFCHANHEPAGRKCEFGASRGTAEQADDLTSGYRCLMDAWGDAVDPIFTPPWNRCTQATADLLELLPYKVLSRDRSASPLQLSEVVEIPVSVDWCRWEQTGGGRNRLGWEIAAAIAADQPVGIMLHHAVMPEDACKAVSDLLDLLIRHGNAVCVSMISLLTACHGNFTQRRA